jgi:hypothetical protein
MNLLLTLSYLVLFGFWLGSYFYAIDMTVNVIVTATLIIYIGSYRSLKLLATVEEGGSAEREVLSSKDAAQFPIVGSCALFGLFCAFKYLDKEMVNIVLSAYFLFVGIFTMTGTLAPFVELVVTSKEKYGFKKTFPVIGEVDAEFTMAEFVSMVPATIFSVYYVKTKHFMMNNVMGISFCVQSIERISIGSYKIGAILLSGLFFYDIFWVFGSEKVFGSNVMVTVAKNFDGPIKLLFPRALPVADISAGVVSAIANTGNSTMVMGAEKVCTTLVKDLGKQLLSEGGNTGTSMTAEAAKTIIAAGRAGVVANKECGEFIGKVMQPLIGAVEGEFSLLGLGDIVIPGIFIAILLRFDAVQAGIKGLHGAQTPFAKPFFNSNIISYALGLYVTLYVMNVWKAAQPALLYLVPACLGASLLASLTTGKFKALLAYDEEETVDVASKDKKE